MPKTTPPGQVVLDHGTFAANVVPDVFDARDLDYRSRLQVIDHEVDCRPEDRYVMEQVGNSCTGHAVAAMVNAVLAHQSDPTHVSPYMLYALARRYDEFEGEADVGSSLRGALKGWYYHGLLPDSEWPKLTMRREPDLDGDDELFRIALQRPLGAFYRVNATRLDDMQSAITELYGIVASASIHDGWRTPEVLRRRVGRKQEELRVITRTPSSRAIGGHAFCIVGYNDVGFLIQNSWGTRWGKGGFATLPYDDWLESGYDAWVARPGVPSVVSRRVRSKLLTQAAGQGIVEAAGPDIQRLSGHVVNLGNNGRLSQSGKFISTKTQIDRIFTQLAEHHDRWAPAPRRIVLYAHGGLNSESTGLEIASHQLQWWLANHVYPITFAWETGVVETLQDQLSDLITGKTPAGGFRLDLLEQVDRMIEKLAKRTLTWVWDEMKENAARAADPLPATWDTAPDDQIPGATLIAEKLAGYRADHPDVEVHLVGHSAGSIFLAGLIDRLVDRKIPVTSLTYLAAAIRTDTWLAQVFPHLANGDVARFTAFGMSPSRELDDICGAGGFAVYHKSLLYLVSRAFERPTSPDDTEVPILGMAHFADQPIGGTSLTQAIATLHDARLAWSPSIDPTDSRSDSSSHGGFDDDNPTMTSVLLRILRTTTVDPDNSYTPNLPPGTTPDSSAAHATALADQPPDITTVAVTGGDLPGPATPAAAAAAPPASTESAASAPAGGAAIGTENRTIHALEQEGWKREDTSGEALAASTPRPKRSSPGRPSTSKPRKKRQQSG